MTRLLLNWLLAGVFLASLGLNVKDWVKGDPVEETGSAPATITAPPCIDLEQLELTPDQEAAVSRCGRSFGADEGELQQELTRQQEALETALAQEELDEEGVRRLAEEVCDLRTRLLKGRVESVIEVRTILSPCQVLQIRGCCKSCPKSGFATGVE